MHRSRRTLYLNTFLAHPNRWGLLALTIWLLSHLLINTTNVYMEALRSNRSLPLWEPLTWEATSIFAVGLLYPALLWVDRHLLCRLPLFKRLTGHALLCLGFSLCHVGIMVSLRKLVYVTQAMTYHFTGPNNPLLFELIYEFRKDVTTYISLFFLTYCFAFIVRRLQGEASIHFQEEDETSQKEPSNPPLRRHLLIKKFGKEFLVDVLDIDWIEAAGNYANLHVGKHVYPMRTTMKNLSESLPSESFIRIHRSTIVNVARIESVSPLASGDHCLRLIDGPELTLSRRYREQFKQLFELASPATDKVNK